VAFFRSFFSTKKRTINKEAINNKTLTCNFILKNNLELMYKLLFLFTFFILQTTIVLAQNKQTKPNIIVIVADDLGWFDLGCYGSSFYETPHLNALAKKGVQFMQAYSTSPVCSPSRASLLTGKYPTKTNITDWIPGRQANGKVKKYEALIGPTVANELALQETTIAEYALENNYTTFFAGKWHLGETENFWPQHQGFSTNIGGWGKGSPTGKINDSTGGFFTPYNNPTIQDGPTGEYLTDRLTNECIQFIKRQQQPFFLLYPMYTVHNPLQAPKPLIEKYKKKQAALGIDANKRFIKNESWMQFEADWKQRTVQDNAVYAAMIENMDNNIGRLLQTLQQLQLDENTIVIFTSDNGGLSTAEGSPTMNGPLKAGKGWLYEGGIRVPFIMYWKNKLQPKIDSTTAITLADIYPTLATAINRNYIKNKSIDGSNIVQLLSNQKAATARALYWHYPHYSNQGGKPGAAIIQGKYKLIYHYENNTTELYNLAVDKGEKNNIAAKEEALCKKLNTQLQAWLVGIKAKAPTNNLQYNIANTMQTKVENH
jgi:arylsulfatase A-like enzyme